MDGNGLLIGEVAKRTGATRKALRLYEEAGLLPPPRRSRAGYRLYGRDAVALLGFVREAQRLGFTLAEIKEIVGIRRAGRAPCPQVHELVRRKAEELDRRLKDLRHVRAGLRFLLDGWRSPGLGRAAVCPHIERASPTKRKPESPRRS